VQIEHFSFLLWQLARKKKAAEPEAAGLGDLISRIYVEAKRKKIH
jgi:hypothetical protein